MLYYIIIYVIVAYCFYEDYIYIYIYTYNIIQSALASERNSVVVGSTAVMAGNDFLAKKASHK